MKIGNINSFNNRDLVIFLQKVGQHEAAKVVKKHQMNGRALLSFRSQKNTVDVTDVEKNHLLRCLTVIQLNPLHGVHLSPKCPSDDSNSISKPDDSFASHMYKQIILRTDNYTDDENGYIHVENVSLQEKDKQEYFKFISRRYKSLDNIVQNSEFNIINRSSTTSSGYIRPKSQIYIQRYEETAVNRVRKYSNQDEINGSEEHIYDRILQPSNIVINSVEDSGKINKKPFVLCNFLLNIFCFSCFINCKKV